MLKPNEHVALYTSAWIEIVRNVRVCAMPNVALYTSAWIEIITFEHWKNGNIVALYTSAWIEILTLPPPALRLLGSHSTRVRGLKYSNFDRKNGITYVALYTSAWIEIISMYISSLHSPRRTLHECVD